jgi:hypothetical protein
MKMKRIPHEGQPKSIFFFDGGPIPETIFQVRIDGKLYRVRARRALGWANQVAERRFSAAEMEEPRRSGR